MARTILLDTSKFNHIVARSVKGYVTGDTPCFSATIGQGDVAISHHVYSYWVR